MKRRMEVSRCCCRGCGPGETSWSDDFSSYTSGEFLGPYGYTDGYENGGGIKPVYTFPDPVTFFRTYRQFPFDPLSMSRVTFEVEFLNHLSGTADRRGGIHIFGQGYLDLNWDEVGITAISYGETDSTDTRTVSYGDIFKIVYRQSGSATAGTQITSTGNADYYHNGTLFVTKPFEFTQQLGLNTGEGHWCASQYGAYVATCVTDNWNFSVDMALEYETPFENSGGTPTGDWEFQNSTAVSLPPITTGGEPTLVYGVSSGSLPAAMSINTSTGYITGTPTTSTTGSVVLDKTDGNGAVVVSKQYDWEVVGTPI